MNKNNDYTSKKIIMVTGQGEYPIMVYNYLSTHFNIKKFIVESPINKKLFLKTRAKRLGWIKTISQIFMRMFIVPFLQFTSKKRIQNIKKSGNLNNTPVDPRIFMKIPSVNSEECITILKEIDPDVIIVVNTRIISEKVLKTIKAKFINIHAGITPKYRGFHGGYWALVNKDKENCGVTIHLVDKGIDTGDILYQDTIEITNEDNYYTYTYLQLVKGLPLLQQATIDVLKNNIKPITSENSPSTLYYHPTLWQYLFNRFIKKVK